MELAAGKSQLEKIKFQADKLAKNSPIKKNDIHVQLIEINRR